MSKKKITKRTKVKLDARMPFVKYVNYNHIMPTRYNVPTELSPSSICTDQQMDTLDGRKEARKFAKSLFQEKFQSPPLDKAGRPSKAILTFDVCCPHPWHRPPPAQYQKVEVVDSPWGDVHLGCDSTFPWAPHALAPALLHGPAYHPNTGEYMEELLPFKGSTSRGVRQDPADAQRPSGAATMAADRTLRVKQEVARRWSRMGFRSFLEGARLYYETRQWGIEMVAILTQIMANFAHSLSECTPVTLLAALIKAESLFDLDLAAGRRMHWTARALLQRALTEGRMNWTLGEETPSTFQSILTMALEHVRELEARRLPPARPWTVDLVFPLCKFGELSAISEGLALIGTGLVPPFDPLDGWPPGTLQARQARDHNRLRGFFRHARFRLFVYAVCGTYGLFGRHADTGSISPQEEARLAEAIFKGLPESILQLFRAPGAGLWGQRGGSHGSLPPLHLAVFEEEVPTGDVAAYVHHLAMASNSETLGNITMLLHPDFLEHIRAWLVVSVFRALLNGAWPQEVDFLYLGWRHEGPVTSEGRVASHLRYHCDIEPGAGGRLGPCDRGYNPRLLENMWRMVFGRDLDPFSGDDLGGYDFSQLLVTRRAVLRRPARYWRYLSRVLSARSSFELLPGTKFISRRIDLSVNDPHNKGVCAWFEHMWHMLFDPRYFPKQDGPQEVDLRSFTRLHDRDLPLGLRSGPDTVLGRHYWLNAEQQCRALQDEQGCRIYHMQQQK
ncbi:RPL27B [Symbiodinium natans]|uniref:RPL27B protein n=1 Tax=Symbiodinium natans TaxID=878477 RepID=A0A812JEP8_9DINO|nr:RPL27B [Symbiodinium natans]